MAKANYIGRGENPKDDRDPGGPSNRPRESDLIAYSVAMADLSDVFSSSGLLASHLPGFSYREPQQQMAELVDQALSGGENAVLEAGTGIGKTFAYVVPILLSGQTAIISTGTKTLQDQLFARDLPALGGALGRPVD